MRRLNIIGLDIFMRKAWNGNSLGDAWRVHHAMGRGDYSLWIARGIVHRRKAV